jgi:hypothetical protein
MTPAGDTRSRITTVLSVLALAVVVFQTAQLFRIIDRFAVDVPFWDQWGFYNAFFTPHSPWEVFSWQHGPHRQGAGAFITQAVNAATDWNQRAQAFMIGAVMTAAAAAFLLLKRRLFGSLQWYDAIPVLMIISLKPVEVYFAALNISHAALPLLLILLLCIALTVHHNTLRCGLTADLYFLTLFTGFGLLVAPVLPMLLIIEGVQGYHKRRWPQACYAGLTLLLCLGSVALFFQNYSFAPAVDCFQFPDERWYLYPVFMAIMFSMVLLPDSYLTLPSITIGLGIVAALLVILAGTFIALYHHDRHYQRRQVIVLLTGYSLVFAAATAAGRICLGLEAATATRYLPLIMTGFIGAYLFFLSIPALANSRVVMPLLFAAAVFIMLTGWPWQRHRAAANYHAGKQAWATAFKQIGDADLAGNIAGFRIYPHPERTGLVGKLEWLRTNNYSLFRDSDAAPD